MMLRILCVIIFLVAIMLRMFRVFYIRVRRLLRMFSKAHVFVFGMLMGWEVSQLMGGVQSW